jgi:hypothetical protein
MSDGSESTSCGIPHPSPSFRNHSETTPKASHARLRPARTTATEKSHRSCPLLTVGIPNVRTVLQEKNYQIVNIVTQTTAILFMDNLSANRCQRGNVCRVCFAYVAEGAATSVNLEVGCEGSATQEFRYGFKTLHKLRITKGNAGDL